ncbi:MAG: hypothetical protein WBG23_08960 [Acidobacteriaceae bacterium]|jgi:hypothetical protein
MRSELVFGATSHIQNRYLLARLTSKTTRSFHRPHTRLEETANDVLRLFGHSTPQEMLRRPSLAGPHVLAHVSESTGKELQDKKSRSIADAIKPGWPAAVGPNL